MRSKPGWGVGSSLLGGCHRTMTARHRGVGKRGSEYRRIFPDLTLTIIQYMATSQMLSCCLLSRAVKSLDLFLELQLTNMSSTVQRASSLKCSITYMTIGKKLFHPRRFNSNSSSYNDSFHFKLSNALFQMIQQGFRAVN